ncbi:hypothetical protein F3157_16940 [Virgibacillus dakarensis]|uniref:Uncharacterized protein n=1 Tax=Lentibacillus populi TaxID=1827502 RepID=A0A9W5X5H8_9BACI|nr:MULTISPECIES: hypothetical protein [Bacillaceae]MBT2214601.1 hypothetical protein [Virgibacillus dakarensis]MTW87327.1 hypothetical protein [Virgibacillus dakarensis]GGB40510.1 hypothetical protein GCM10011409_17520 [Lentibacillus populi]
MEYVYNIIFAILTLVIQHFLSTRKRAYFGAILPIIFTVFMWGWVFAKVKDGDTSDFYFAFILGLAILLGGWIEGRESLKKKRIRELNKMKTYDMQ